MLAPSPALLPILLLEEVQDMEQLLYFPLGIQSSVHSCDTCGLC